MNENEQRIAIAEAMGRKFHFDTTTESAQRTMDEFVPDYLNDLNAMHEAEKVLRNNQFHFVNYLQELWTIVNPHTKYTGSLGYLGFEYVNATAAQRAEALLRTLGKWKDDETAATKPEGKG